MTKFQKALAVITLLVMFIVMMQIPVFMISDQVSDSVEKEKLSEEKTTPIATSDELYKLLSTEELKKAGIRLYASEEEYLEEQKLLGAELLEEWETYSTLPINFTFTVKDQKYNKPISGAVVIIDGVPRFTDVNGQIQVKIMSEVIELRVEKDGYNPYVEYYDVYSASESGVTEKTIILKNPSYDMEISNVIIDYDGEKANVIQQPYTFDKMESYEDSIDICVENIGADMYFLYNGNQLIKKCSSNEFSVPISSFEKRTDNGPVSETLDGNIQLVVEKNGILSQGQNLRLEIVELKDLDPVDYLQLSSIVGSDEDSYTIKIEDEYDLIGNLKIGYLEALKDALKIKAGKVNLEGFHIQYIYDNLKGTYKFVFGVDLGFKSKGMKKLEKKAIYNKFEKSYNMRKNNINPNARNQSVSEALWGAFKKVRADSNDIRLSAADIDFYIPLEFTGYIEISNKAFTGELSGKDAVVAGGFDISIGLQVQWTKHIFVTVPVVLIVVPVYITIGTGATFGISYDYQQMQDMQHAIDLIMKFNFNFGVGVGVYGLFSAGVYGKGDIEILYDLINNKLKQKELNISCGILFGILGFDIDCELLNYAEVKKFKLTTLAANAVENANNNGFIDARPSSIYLDNTKLSVWLEKDLSRNQYNQTKLMYSYGDITGSVYDDGKADYYPELMLVDNEAYVVWHKSSILFDGTETVADAFGKSNIIISKFNKQTQSFDVIKQIDTNAMATMPKIAKNSSADKIGVIWFNNTQNDPLGTSGTNNIYAAEISDGTWSEPELVFSTEKLITKYDASYVDGTMKVVCSVDTDADYATGNVLDLYYGTKGHLENITNDNIEQRDAEFGSLNGMPVIYYLQENDIYMYNLNSNTESLIVGSDVRINSFEVVDEIEGVILYLTQGEDGQQINLARYNASENVWEYGLKIHSDKNYININSCVNNSALEIQGVAFNLDGADGITIEGVNSEILEITSDIELLEAYLLDNVHIGSNDIYLRIKNHGSAPINSFNYSINEEVFTQVLTNALEPNSEAIVCIQWQCSVISENIEVAISLEGETNLDDNYYNIDTSYADLSMDIIKKYSTEGKETLHIVINNNMASEQEFKILIRRDNKYGEIIYTSSDFMIDGNGKIESDIALDYYELNCKQYDKLYIEIQTQSEMLVPCESAVIIEEKVPTYDSSKISEAVSLLATAKRITGGII